MAPSLSSLLVHVVFSTKDRARDLDADRHRRHAYEDELVSFLKRNEVEHDERSFVESSRRLQGSLGIRWSVLPGLTPHTFPYTEAGAAGRRASSHRPAAQSKISRVGIARPQTLRNISMAASWLPGSMVVQASSAITT